MLKWFVDGKVMAAAIKYPGKYLIEEEHVETRPEQLPDAVLDENVDVHLIRKFFTHDAWLLVADVVKQKRVQLSSVKAATMIFMSNHLLCVNTVFPGIICNALV